MKIQLANNCHKQLGEYDRKVDKMMPQTSDYEVYDRRGVLETIRSTQPPYEVMTTA